MSHRLDCSKSYCCYLVQSHSSTSIADSPSMIVCLISYDFDYEFDACGGDWQMTCLQVEGGVVMIESFGNFMKYL